MRRRSDTFPDLAAGPEPMKRWRIRLTAGFAAAVAGTVFLAHPQSGVAAVVFAASVAIAVGTITSTARRATVWRKIQDELPAEGVSVVALWFNKDAVSGCELVHRIGKDWLSDYYEDQRPEPAWWAPLPQVVAVERPAPAGLSAASCVRNFRITSWIGKS